MTEANTAGRTVTFGVNVDPVAVPADELVALARVAEDSGFDLIGIQDHPYQARFYDTWTLIAYLAANTRSIAYTPNVANLGLRTPAMLAKSAATLSRLLGGRLVCGVGAGASGGPIPAMGGIDRSGPAMIAYAEQSIELMRTALRGDIVKLHTDQFDVRGYRGGPAASVPLWVGGRMRKMLGVIGRAADGWLSPGSSSLKPGMVPRLNSLIDDAAVAAGRDPASIRRIYNVQGVVGRPGAADLAGPVEAWVEWLVDWAGRLGFDGFVFWPMTDPAHQTAVFGNEVIPRVREALAARTAVAPR
ncbi:LLM class flavin-dependent oxidoreductase [Amycolatopsis sp. FDAARGOS 1241]|uniref:LLM class flavin-dependent oxidoreductase n=1 Tax=Amycolatopsis sp. FDAARGOS 1241 TaxID=2778070 RepID=UPI00194E7551|nr:LLM class flavin-dependent oxidoreductase [Amycolatopsis sp. FDAARGOS 1241]QRP50323.1 LLM class flavin-dependent oxidoreductase [Amycolatopsis sp. FDAARGOS 1241]